MTDLAPAPPASSLLADSRLTAMGLFYETQAGMRMAIEADLEQHGITVSAFEVLVRLGRSPEQRLRMSDLADQATLSNSGLTRVIDRLLAAGYVRRLRHDHDRRVYYAVLTPEGHHLLDQVIPSHLQIIEECMTSVLTPEELDAFTQALRKIRAVVKPASDPQLTPPGAT